MNKYGMCTDMCTDVLYLFCEIKVYVMKESSGILVWRHYPVLG